MNEEVEWSSHSRRNIEHVIRDADDVIRPVRPEDLYVERNRGVMEAFKYLYRLHKDKQTYSKPDEKLYRKPGGMQRLPKSYDRK